MRMENPRTLIVLRECVAVVVDSICCLIFEYLIISTAEIALEAATIFRVVMIWRRSRVRGTPSALH
jgi:hypothetical protein